MVANGNGLCAASRKYTTPHQRRRGNVFLMNYGILGMGRLGTALAKFLGEREEVYLWGRDEALVKRVQFDRTNELYLPGVELPYEVRATYDLEHMLDDVDVLISAVPSWGFSDILEKCVGYLHQLEAFICGTTGYDPETGRRLSQEYLECVETLDNYYVLAGPALPHEIIAEQPGNLLLGGGNDHNRDRLKEILYRKYLRVYGTEDLIGLETISSLNNLIAVIGGLVEGFELENGTRASLMVRGLHEIKQIVKYEGGKPSSVLGTGGLGSAIAIGTSSSSRNYRLGVALGQGESLEQARSSIGGCLESPGVAKVVHRRILKGELKTPLLTELYGILHEELDPFNSFQKVINLKRPPEDEGGS
jgi:glycerol-3-phosphate dehydrogenase (NAD(P)+)